ncbi:hypothetical protein MTR62_17005, partial [Novosphingobium sp. 1949]
RRWPPILPARPTARPHRSPETATPATRAQAPFAPFPVSGPIALMPIDNAGVVAAEERAHFATLLSRYPEHVTTHEADAIANWLERVASRADQRALATDPRTCAQYRRFRAEHGGATLPEKLGKAVLLVSIVTAVAAALSLLAA